VHATIDARQDGFKGRVAVEPETGLFSAAALAKAAGEANHEAIIAPTLLTENPPGTAVLGDSAYGTRDIRAALADTGHDAVIKPPLLTKDDDIDFLVAALVAGVEIDNVAQSCLDLGVTAHTFTGTGPGWGPMPTRAQRPWPALLGDSRTWSPGVL
jgi:hypothetical protein